MGIAFLISHGFFSKQHCNHIGIVFCFHELAFLQAKPSKKKMKKEKKVKKSKTKYSSSEDELDKMERERKEDLAERDAFAKRVRDKDKDKQRKIMEKSDFKAHAEAAKRLKIEAESKEKHLPQLREESRRSYLKKRETDKLIELKDDLNDDKFLFDDSQLTKREREDRRYKEKILNLADAYSKASEIEKVQRYHMPEDRKNIELDQYVEANEKEKQPNYEQVSFYINIFCDNFMKNIMHIIFEQKKWEEEHLQSARYKFGAKDAKKRHEEKSKKYDLILDDEIEFIQALKMPGSSKDKDKGMYVWGVFKKLVKSESGQENLNK